MRIPNEAHTGRPWRIHEVVPDFRLEDVWLLPGVGGPDDFPRVVELVASFDPGQSSSPLVRALFALRWKLGGLLGWDDEGRGLGRRVPTLRDRLPEDLRGAPSGPVFGPTPFTPLYQLDDELAAEVANDTMHGVLHLGWVPDDGQPGRYRVQMAVYVKPNGVKGELYMAAIKPFRYLIAYPQLMRESARVWAEAQAASAAPSS